MSDSIDERNLRSQNPGIGRDGYRTPATEDNDHPWNLWRSGQAQQTTSRIDSGSPPLNRQTSVRFARNQKFSSRPAIYGRKTNGTTDTNKQHLPWRERLKHTTWAYFTMTMATGGIANVLHNGM